MVQVMVAEVDVIAVAVTAEITGATAVVVKVALGEVVDTFALLAETTSKSYSVPCVKPVIVTECEVTSAPLSGDCEP